MEIKKGLMKLLLGTSLLVSPLLAHAQEYSPNIQRLKNSLTQCIKTNNCDEFENLRKSLGIGLGENRIDESSIFYYDYNDGKYLGLIKDKEIKNGINFYYAKKLASSFSREFIQGITYKDGSKDIVLGNLVETKNRCQNTALNWASYVSNNSKFRNESNWNRSMQAVYNALNKGNGTIEEKCFREEIICNKAHESILHEHLNRLGESLAYSNEIVESPYALKDIENLSRRIPKNSSEEYYTSVVSKVRSKLIKIAGSERKLYQANRAQLKKYAEQLKEELSR